VLLVRCAIWCAVCGVQMQVEALARQQVAAAQDLAQREAQQQHQEWAKGLAEVGSFSCFHCVRAHCVTDRAASSAQLEQSYEDKLQQSHAIDATRLEALSTKQRQLEALSKMRDAQSVEMAEQRAQHGVEMATMQQAEKRLAMHVQRAVEYMAHRRCIAWVGRLVEVWRSEAMRSRCLAHWSCVALVRWRVSQLSRMFGRWCICSHRASVAQLRDDQLRSSETSEVALLKAASEHEARLQAVQFDADRAAEGHCAALQALTLEAHEQARSAEQVGHAPPDFQPVAYLLS
jgi:hypothetical protein